MKHHGDLRFALYTFYLKIFKRINKNENNIFYHKNKIYNINIKQFK